MDEKEEMVEVRVVLPVSVRDRLVGRPGKFAEEAGKILAQHYTEANPGLTREVIAEGFVAYDIHIPDNTIPHAPFPEEPL